MKTASTDIYTGTEAQKRASTEYNRRRCSNIMLRPTKEEGAQIRQAAADAGQSVQGYVLGAVRVQMDKDKEEKA